MTDAPKDDIETEPSRRPMQALWAVEPTEQLLWWTVGVGVVGLASAGLTSLQWAAPVMGAGVVVASLVDWLLATHPGRVRVQRTCATVWVQGEPTAITWQLRAPVPVVVEVTDSPPAAAEPDLLSARVRLVPGIVQQLEHTATVRSRGAHRFGRIALRTLGPLGLVRRRERRAVDTELQVVPDLARIAARAERLLRGQDADGARRRRARSEGREFESLREYVRGDDIRLVEWKASARAGTLVVRRMQPETRQDVVVLLDTGRQLAGLHSEADGGGPRMDVALTTSLVLGAAALSRGDRVAMLTFAGDVRGWVPPLAGRGHLKRLGESASAFESLSEEPDYSEALRFVLAQQKRRAMVVIITDVTDEPSARALAGAVARLRGRHLPVVVAISDPATARLAKAAGEDDRTRALRLAAERILTHRRAALAALGATGANVVDAPAPRAAAMAVQAYVGLKALGRL